MKLIPFKCPPQPLKTNLFRVKLCTFTNANPLVGSAESLQITTAGIDESLVSVTEYVVLITQSDALLDPIL